MDGGKMGGKNYVRILNISKTRLIRSIYMPLMFALILSVSLQSVNAAWDVPPKAENKYCGALSIGAEVSRTGFENPGSYSYVTIARDDSYWVKDGNGNPLYYEWSLWLRNDKNSNRIARVVIWNKFGDLLQQAYLCPDPILTNQDNAWVGASEGYKHIEILYEVQQPTPAPITPIPTTPIPTTPAPTTPIPTTPIPTTPQPKYVLALYVYDSKTFDRLEGAKVYVDNSLKATVNRFGSPDPNVYLLPATYSIRIFKDGCTDASFSVVIPMQDTKYVAMSCNVVQTTQNPILSSTSISPSSVLPGQSFTGYYVINNPNSASVNVGLGLSIRRSGTYGEIVDKSNDVVISAAPGTNTYSRTFTVSSSASAGSYDVAQAIWSGSPGTGTQYATSGWKSVVLTVQQTPATNTAPSASRYDPSSSSVSLTTGQSKTFTVRCTDNEGNLRGVDWYLNGQYKSHGSPYPISGSSTTNSWSYTFNSAGTYTVESQCWDDANGDGKEDLYSTAAAWTVTFAQQLQQLNVELVGPSNGEAIITLPIEFKVRVTANGNPVKDANVMVYFGNGGSSSSGWITTNSEGYATYTSFYSLTTESTVSWYAEAYKSGYTSGTSQKWEFSYQKLEPSTKKIELSNGEYFKLDGWIYNDGEPYLILSKTEWFSDQNRGKIRWIVVDSRGNLVNNELNRKILLSDSRLNFLDSKSIESTKSLAKDIKDFVGSSDMARTGVDVSASIRDGSARLLGSIIAAALTGGSSTVVQAGKVVTTEVAKQAATNIAQEFVVGAEINKNRFLFLMGRSLLEDSAERLEQNARDREAYAKALANGFSPDADTILSLDTDFRGAFIEMRMGFEFMKLAFPNVELFDQLRDISSNIIEGAMVFKMGEIDKIS
ncbi:MAG: hypothetical protein Q7U60_09960, partial [Candidatus Methanoperedens sp.]|nr:hypothetical protein [Candidatus Methanoperedens sp.]